MLICGPTTPRRFSPDVVIDRTKLNPTCIELQSFLNCLQSHVLKMDLGTYVFIGQRVSIIYQSSGIYVINFAAGDGELPAELAPKSSQVDTAQP